MLVFKHLLMKMELYKKFNSIINGVGSGVSSGITGEGWSRKFLLNYRNGTAVVGKANNSDQKVNILVWIQ